MCSMADYGLCRERPSTLRFTHDSVSCTFSNGMSLQDTFRQFLYDELDIDDMQCLVAMYYNGKWLVVRGNRRLYLYKKLQKVGKLTMVNVDKQRFDQALFERQYTSKNMGVAIRIRGFPNINTVLNQIANEWKNTQSLQTRTKSNAYVPSPRSTGFKRTPTPSVNRNYPGTSQTYVPPPRSTDYIAPTLSIYSNNSGTSQTNKKDTTWCDEYCIIL